MTQVKYTDPETGREALADPFPTGGRQPRRSSGRAYVIEWNDIVSITGVSTLLDLGSDWYVVSPDAEFSMATIEAGQFEPVITCCPSFHIVDNLFQPNAPSLDLYLGVATSDGSAKFDRNVFGWVHLEAGNMVANAMAYGAEGIIVGSNSAVPEPASGIGIVVAGSLILLSVRR